MAGYTDSYTGFPYWVISIIVGVIFIAFISYRCYKKYRSRDVEVVQPQV